MPRKRIKLKQQFKRFFKAIKKFRSVRDEHFVGYTPRKKYNSQAKSDGNEKRVVRSKRTERYLIGTKKFLSCFIHEQVSCARGSFVMLKEVVGNHLGPIYQEIF